MYGLILCLPLFCNSHDVLTHHKTFKEFKVWYLNVFSPAITMDSLRARDNSELILLGLHDASNASGGIVSQIRPQVPPVWRNVSLLRNHSAQSSHCS